MTTYNEQALYARFLLLVLAAIISCLIIIFLIIANYTYDKTSSTSLLDALKTDESMYQASISKAIVWQDKNKGVVGGPALLFMQYKNRMLDYYMGQQGVDTLILGSSNALSIRDFMFPSERRFFNAANNEFNLAKTLLQAKQQIQTNPELKWVYINIDWAFGYPYQDENLIPAAITQGNHKPQLRHVFEDAFSTQRAKVVLSNILGNSAVNKPYQCPKENRLGIDLSGAQRPGICEGFRYDGSVTFSGARPLTQTQWQKLLSLQGTALYRGNLEISQGDINPYYLNELIKLDKRLKERQGHLVIIIPPMAPKITEFILQSPQGAWLQKTFDTINHLSQVNHIALLDMSRSEDYGCTYNDFLDAHHAYPSCVAKIFQQYWQ